MIKKIDISIIIPIYNCENYIANCINSIIAQKGVSLEVIFINDGSTDNSAAIINQYTKNYKNFKLISQENKGAAAARNKGIEHISGKYVLFIDADDYILENSLEDILKEANKEELDIMQLPHYTNYNNKIIKEKKIYPIKKSIDGISYFKKMQKKRCLITGTFNHLIKTDFLKQLPFRFDGNLIRCQDMDFFSKAILKAKHIKNYGKPYYMYNYETPTGGNYTRKNYQLVFDCYDTIRCNFQTFVIKEKLGSKVLKRLNYMLSSHIYGYDTKVIASLPIEKRRFWAEFTIKYMFWNKGWLRPWLYLKYFHLKQFIKP